MSEPRPLEQIIPDITNLLTVGRTDAPTRLLVTQYLSEFADAIRELAGMSMIADNLLEQRIRAVIREEVRHGSLKAAKAP